MDHELKQRLIGAVVVTALCAIFIPMLFDDPVDTSGQSVSELSIPAPSEPSKNGQSVPTSAEQVLASQDPEPLTTEATGEALESTGSLEEVAEEPVKTGQSEESLYAESEGYIQGDSGQQEVAELPDDAPVNRPKPRPKAHEQSSGFAQSKPLSADALEGVHKSASSKAQVKETRVETLVQEPVKVKKPVETIKPVTVKKPDIEPSTIPKESAAKIGGFNSLAKEQDVLRQIKQPPTSAKSLAAAVADAKRPEVSAPKAPPKLVRWYIQLGSFSKKENALSLWDSLHEQGLPASLDTVQTDKGTSYRLRVGPELDGKKAAAMKARLDKLNIKAILMSE
jgi:DedD protein